MKGPFALSQATLARHERSSLELPTYDRSAIGVGVVHVGVGGFHRSHQACYIDSLLRTGSAGSWGICGVGLLPVDEAMERVLHGQNCLYTLIVRHPDGHSSCRVVGSIVRYLWAPRDPGAVLGALTDPRARIVSLTITEGGYSPDSANTSGTPVSAFGYIARALQLRRDAQIAPFTVLSCDNVRGNGRIARQATLAAAAARDRGLAEWIEANVAFPNSMVDRITPATTDDDRALVAQSCNVADQWPVVAEPFSQWVIEDRFPAGRPPLADAGVELVDDVEAYELMKIRMLNGSHQVLCYLAALAGHTYVHEAMADPEVRHLVETYLRDEAIPSLSPVAGIDYHGYARIVLQRFANRYIRDTVARLCEYGSDRLPTFVVPVLRHNLAGGAGTETSVKAIAAWRQWLSVTDSVTDHRANQLQSAARNPDPLAFVADTELFGDLVQYKHFVDQYIRACSAVGTLHA